MCAPDITFHHLSRLDAEERDALREFAHKRARRAITPHAREFWEGVMKACCHPKTDVPVTGEAK